mgnify:CR=1 FL=1
MGWYSSLALMPHGQEAFAELVSLEEHIFYEPWWHVIHHSTKLNMTVVVGLGSLTIIDHLIQL